MTCWPRFLFDLIEDSEDVEVIPYYYSATTVSHKSDTPFYKNEAYKAALKSEPDIVVMLLGMNDSKKGKYDKKLFQKDYIRMITDFKELKSKPAIFPVIPTPLYAEPFTM